MRTNLLAMSSPSSTNHATASSRIWIRDIPEELRIRGINSAHEMKQQIAPAESASSELTNLYSNSSKTKTKSKRKLKYPILAATRKTIELSVSRSSRSRRISREQTIIPLDVDRGKSAPDGRSFLSIVSTCTCADDSKIAKNYESNSERVLPSRKTSETKILHEQRRTSTSCCSPASQSRPPTSDLQLRVRRSTPLTPGEQALKSQKESYDKFRQMEQDKEKRQKSARHDPDRLSTRKVMRFLRTPNHPTTPNRRRARPYTDTELYRARKEQAREQIGSGITCLPELGRQQDGQGSLLYFGDETQKSHFKNSSGSNMPGRSPSSFPAIDKSGLNTKRLPNDNGNYLNAMNAAQDYKCKLNALISARGRNKSSEYVRFKVLNDIEKDGKQEADNHNNDRFVERLPSRESPGNEKRTKNSKRVQAQSSQNIASVQSMIVEPKQTDFSMSRARYNFPSDSPMRHSIQQGNLNTKRLNSNSSESDLRKYDHDSRRKESKLEQSRVFMTNIDMEDTDNVAPTGDPKISTDNAPSSLPLFQTTKIQPVPFPISSDKNKLMGISSKSLKTDDTSNEEPMAVSSDEEIVEQHNKKSVINVFIPIS